MLCNKWPCTYEASHNGKCADHRIEELELKLELWNQEAVEHELIARLRVAEAQIAAVRKVSFDSKLSWQEKHIAIQKILIKMVDAQKTCIG